MRTSRGFTLVEIMIALGIFALVSVTVYARMGDVLRQSQGLEDRTLATWVAQNRLAALALEYRSGTETVPIGRRSELVSLAGRSWRVNAEISATSDAELRRVEIQVRSVAAGDTTADPDSPALARMIGFLGRY